MWGPFAGGLERELSSGMQAVQEAYDATPTTQALRSYLQSWLAPQIRVPRCTLACQVRSHAIRLLEHVAFRHEDAATESFLPLNVSGSSIHADALWELGEHSLWGTHGAMPNISRAIRAYERLANTGNATAHARLGFLYGSPVIAAVYGIPRNDARAILHYESAAAQGDRHSTLALAYRSLHGLGVPKDCMQALRLYERQANVSYKASQEVLGGRVPTYTKWPIHVLERWSRRSRDLPVYLHRNRKSGVFIRSSRHYLVSRILRRNPRLLYDQNARLDMLRLLDEGQIRDLGQLMFLALALYHGSMLSQSETIAAIPRDPVRSAQVAKQVVHRHWPEDLSQIPKKNNLDEDEESSVKEAAELLGMQYLRGEGVEKDERLAHMWLQRSLGEDGSYGLGLIALHGLGGFPQDAELALEYFSGRKGRVPPASQLELIKHALTKNNLAMASREDPDVLMRIGETAYMVYPRVEQPYIRGRVCAALLKTGNATCEKTVGYFREAAERGDWSDPIFHRGNAAYARGDIPTALLAFAIAAEQGMRFAQENVAFLLDQRASRNSHREKCFSAHCFEPN